jgi:hypothetical protein
VGAKANPPKKLRSPPKNGNVIAMNMVNPASKKHQIKLIKPKPSPFVKRTLLLLHKNQ